MILTNYPVDYLPGFENTQKSVKFDNLDIIKTNLQDSESQYVLYPSNLSGEIQKYFQSLIDDKELVEVFNTKSWIPYSFAVINHVK